MEHADEICEDIRRQYEADRDNLYLQPDSMDLAFLIITTTPENADAIKPELEALRQLALEKEDLAAALEEMPQLKAYYAEISVDPGSYGIYARSHADVLACAADLKAGDISRVFQQEGWLCLIHCRQRTAHDYVPLEDVESVVIQSIRESRYDALIAGRMEAQELTGNLSALSRFTAEQLP